MKFPLSRKWTIGLIIAAVLVLIIGAIATHGQGKEIYVTQTVTRADVKKTVDVTGAVNPLSHMDLSFLTSGNVSRIFVKVGEMVNAGELLASLSADDLSADARRAEADLDLVLADAKPEDVAAAKADVTSAQVALENAQTARIVVTATNGSSEKNTADAVAKAKEDEAATTADTLRDVLSALNSSVIDIRTGLSKADELLGQENTLFNDSFEREFSAMDPQALAYAKDYFSRARVDRDLAETAVAALTLASSEADITAAITVTDRALKETADTLLYTRRGLDGTAANSVDLSLTDLVSYKANIDAARASVDTAKTNLTHVVGTRETQNVAASHAVTSAELSLGSTIANNTKELASAEANVKTAEANVVKAQAAYDKLIAPPRTVDVAPYAASRDSATARYAKTTITAPIAGKVGKVALRVGEAVNAGTGVISLEPTSTTFEVVVDIPESDIAHLALGSTAEVTFDAFGSDAVFTGTLSTLDSSEKTIEGVVFYEARVAITDGPFMDELKNGMSADVSILVDSKENVLSVPTRAVLEKDGKKIVRVLVNDELIEKEVAVGLRGDNGSTEILSGVSEGDVIIVSIKK